MGRSLILFFFIFWTTILRNSFSLYNSLGEKNLNTIKGFPPAETHTVPDRAEGGIEMTFRPLIRKIPFTENIISLINK